MAKEKEKRANCYEMAKGTRSLGDHTAEFLWKSEWLLGWFYYDIPQKCLALYKTRSNFKTQS